MQTWPDLGLLLVRLDFADFETCLSDKAAPFALSASHPCDYPCRHPVLLDVALPQLTRSFKQVTSGPKGEGECKIELSQRCSK